ncbi:MAG: enoyl-CoA hydratase [Rhizobacter sp.]|nr:enoyl-CoA hydratase [Rhizobacter sp.]
MNFEPSNGSIVLQRPEPGIALLRISRPAAFNALTLSAMAELKQRLSALETDDTVRAVILTGQGGGFCAGLDLKSMLDADQNYTLDLAGAYELQEHFDGAVRLLRRSNKIVIAAVNGAAVGAGFAMALGADLRIAGRRATFHIGAVKIGLTAGECGISYHLPRLIGATRAFEVMLTGRPIAADEAERIGLVSSVVDDAELEPSAIALAQAVLRNSPYSTRHTKRVMWANLDAPSLDAAIELENRAQVLALMTEDFAEGVRAFVGKREPKFTGK